MTNILEKRSVVRNTGPELLLVEYRGSVVREDRTPVMNGGELYGSARSKHVGKLSAPCGVVRRERTEEPPVAQQAPKKAHFTYRDYLRWPEGERWELVNGVPRAMTPAPSRRHQEVLGELHLEIGIQLRGRTCRAYIAPFDVRLPENAPAPELDDDQVVQPDLVVVCDPAKLDERASRLRLAGYSLQLRGACV